MEKLKCIIIEDEPLAADILRDYISEISFLELEGFYIDALSALEALQRTKIDVIFLDIHLPKLKGFDFIRTLKEMPDIIITTAYREYALDGYELNITDYLLKPISFTRFLMAVNRLKVTDGKIPVQSSNRTQFPEDKRHLIIIVNKKKIKISLDEILYMESREKYIHIVTSNQIYQTRMQLTEMEERLDKKYFLRTHRSFIIAKQKVNSFTALQLEIQSHTIPIGRSYREQVVSDLRG